MVKGIHKGKKRESKRQTLQQKYKVQKKVKQHNKRVKKEANRMKALGIYKKKSKKEIGLPNLYPFKAQVIKSIESKKIAKEKEKQLEKLKSKDRPDYQMNVQQTQQYEEEYTRNQQLEQELLVEKYSLGKEKKKFMKELRKVLESSDIILEVLDARDPMGCRCKEIEAQIQAMSGEKKIILVVNKIDLIPQANAEAWLKYLRREYATVLFKANTQNQSKHLSQEDLYKKALCNKAELVDDLLSSSKSVGAENLLQLIKNYSKKDGAKQSVTVGVFGYPNVGKSSLINSLKKSRAVGVSSTPGFTKNYQEIQLDNQVKLLDCPGIVFSNEGEKSLVLRNIIKVEQIKDPISPIDEITKKVDKNQILMLYKIPDFNSTTELLGHVGKARGKLIKGGRIDLEQSAKIILNDWNSGKLKYFSLPPSAQQSDVMTEE